MAVLSAMSSACCYLFADRAVARMDPLMLGALEFVLAVLPASLWALHQGSHREVRLIAPRTWGLIMLQGLLTSSAIFCVWVGLGTVDPTSAALLGRLEVLVTVALGALVLGEHLGGRLVLGGVISFAGVLLMRWEGPIEVRVGLAWILVSTIFFATAEIVAKLLAPRVTASLFLLVRTPLLAAMFVAALLGHAAIRGHPVVLPDATGIALATGLALFGPILARAFYFAALRRTAITRVALINQSQPLFVGLLSFALAHEVPGGRELLGGLLIVAGTILLLRGGGTHDSGRNSALRLSKISLAVR